MFHIYSALLVYLEMATYVISKTSLIHRKFWPALAILNAICHLLTLSPKVILNLRELEQVFFLFVFLFTNHRTWKIISSNVWGFVWFSV